MDDEDGMDRRKLPRYPVRMKIRLRKAGAAEWGAGTLLTVGSGGVFIKTVGEFAKADEVELELPFRSATEVVRGVVKWICSGKMPGLGVEFISPPAVLSDQIVDAVVSGYWLSEKPAGRGDKSKSDFIIGDISEFLADL